MSFYHSINFSLSKFLSSACFSVEASILKRWPSCVCTMSSTEAKISSTSCASLQYKCTYGQYKPKKTCSQLTFLSGEGSRRTGDHTFPLGSYWGFSHAGGRACSRLTYWRALSESSSEWGCKSKRHSLFYILLETALFLVFLVFMEIIAIHVANSISFFQTDHFTQVCLGLNVFLDFLLHCCGDCVLYKKFEVSFFLYWIWSELDKEASKVGYTKVVL